MIFPRLVAFIGSLSFLPVALSLSLGFPYGSQKVRGVNLGGWLVLEVHLTYLRYLLQRLTTFFFQPWITPSLFDATGDPRIIDEWTFGQYQDRELASKALKAHWDSWITEADFAAIAAAG